MPHNREDSLEFLSALAVPKASPRAIEAILEKASAASRPPAWIDALRRARAYLFVPSVRMGVVAAFLLLLMLLGLGKPSAPMLNPDQEIEVAILQPAPSDGTPASVKLKKKQLLMDVDFSEENWAKNVWEPSY